MATTFEAELVTPERVLYEGEAEMVALRTEEGESAFLANHAPYVGALVPGVVRFIGADGTEERAAVHGGFVYVRDNHLSVVSEVAELAGEIDVERARTRLGEFESRAGGEDDAQVEAAQARAQARVDAATTS
ncbi:MAG: ATP synthase F1 subunit epsilon [Acidimicrobiales bacterium]